MTPVTTPRVTALGGGHGLSVTLEALRQVTNDLVAVVTVADNGGSSGRLRRELGGLPPGDLRMALAALCGSDSKGRQWAHILQSRFQSDGPLNGHAIGNLLIEGVWQQMNPVAGLRMVGELLGVRGQVLPMSLVPLSIEANVAGLDPDDPQATTLVIGQHEVASTQGEVQSIRLVPPNPPACPEAVDAIAQSDAVVLGPGSWFTSLLPHLLVPELRDALVHAAGRRILTLNIASGGETEGFSPSRHLQILEEHAPGLRFDVVLVDQRFAKQDENLEATAAKMGAEVVVADVRRRDGTLRHDPLRLAAIYREILES